MSSRDDRRARKFANEARRKREDDHENRPALCDDDLETILIIARNEQSGRVTEFEIKELVRVYREHLKATSNANR